MASFLRSLLQVAFGFVLGAVAMIFLLPKLAQNQGPKPIASSKSAATPASKPDSAPRPTLFGSSAGPAPAPVEPATPSRVEPAPAPAPPSEPKVAVVTPAPPVVVEAPAVEAPVDFRELCTKPAAWPPVITLKREFSAKVIEDGQVIAEIPLSPGERLQVSKVFGDGTVEVRAKGAKFVVPHGDTDLEPQARARLAAISGRPHAPAAPAVAPTPAPVATTPVQAPAPAPTPPPRGQPQPASGADGRTLDEKMHSLFGNSQKK